MGIHKIIILIVKVKVKKIFESKIVQKSVKKVQIYWELKNSQNSQNYNFNSKSKSKKKYLKVKLCKKS